jgi:DNA-binding sugar fermentation-stimulating protein
MDRVDKAIKQWRQEKPDLEVKSMALISLLSGFADASTRKWLRHLQSMD